MKRQPRRLGAVSAPMIDALLTRVPTPGAFYVQEKQVFIGHVAIADCIDEVYAARVADALNYRKRSR